MLTVVKDPELGVQIALTWEELETLHDCLASMGMSGDEFRLYKQIADLLGRDAD